MFENTPSWVMTGTNILENKGKKWNIGLICVNYALAPVKPEQEKAMVTECFWVLRRR